MDLKCIQPNLQALTILANRNAMEHLDAAFIQESYYVNDQIKTLIAGLFYYSLEEDRPINDHCKMCGNGTETAIQILCECEVLARLHLRRIFPAPTEIMKSPSNQISRYIR